ncbi:hypothetical protein Scep_000709 [Stephania cephalantha]|uniref:Cyclin-like domain-containing protein n=1 Tax=Stephania cephalantha TaxID=152367 RepID=A0AAP0Q399_9MAGN
MAATHDQQGSSAAHNSTTHRYWYVSRKQIEEDSPSRRDGMSLALENRLRVSYSEFLQELGSELNLLEETKATATLYCHRFFLVKSHMKYNNWRTIAAGCMNIACRVEKTTPLVYEKDIVSASFEILRKFYHTPISVTEEMIDKQAENVSTADELVLTTLGNDDINVSHPYKCLDNTSAKFQCPSKNEFDCYAREIAKETWLETSLCLQYKPEHIAGAAIYLAVQRFKEGVQYNGEKAKWWHEFDVPPRRLKDIGNHMLEEYAIIIKPFSPEDFGYPTANTTNLRNRSDPEEQEQFMPLLIIDLPDPDELFLKYPVEKEKSTQVTDRSWYVSRKWIEFESPSRRDGVPLDVENAMHIKYSNMQQELGKQLFLDELTIAAAIVYFHRFCLRRYHGNRKRWVISAACMFLASENANDPRPLKDIITEYCKIIANFKDGNSATNLTIKEERMDEAVRRVSEEAKTVAATLDNDGLDVHHPDEWLFPALQKFQGPSKYEACQFATNVAIQTWLKTTLCLQYKPEHIAVAAIYLAEKHFEDSIRYDSEVVLWDEFDVPLPLVEDIGNHMLEEWVRKKNEGDSPSRRDGVALDVENFLRRSYSKFLQELGSKLELAPSPLQWLQSGFLFASQTPYASLWAPTTPPPGSALAKTLNPL